VSDRHGESRHGESLVPFVQAAVLSQADVHMARALCALGGVHDDEVMLAVALAARAPRLGHTGVVLAQVATSVVAEVPANSPLRLDELAWPDADHWLERVAASPLVSALPDRLGRPDPERPLVLAGELLSLQRYWAYERLVAENLAARFESPEYPGARDGSSPDSAVDDDTTEDRLKIARLLLSGPGSDQQLTAVRTALGQRVTVLTGGPGTGKTTTVAALLAALLYQPAPESVAGDGVEPLRLEVALAAPTGKAAARLSESFRAAAAQLPEHLAQRLAVSEASTIHRLLGTSRHGYQHHRTHPLPHDVVIVDESSMVSLPLIAHLLDAVAPTTRLVIVGDPGQLASVESGTVLADLVEATESVAGAPANSLASALAHGVVHLSTSRRFAADSGIGRLAHAINSGDLTAAVEVLESDPSGTVAWIPYPDGAPDRAGFDESVAGRIRAEVMPSALATVHAGLAGEPEATLESLERVRLLCAHRRGPFGVGYWNRRIRAWVASDAGLAGSADWLVGEPVLVTANDYRLRLFNGDLGAIVLNGDPRQMRAAFAETSSAGGVTLFDPLQIESLESAYAMTIHKSQGSEFDHVIVVLPPAESRLASRELLYTAVTRARHSITVVGSLAMVTAAIERRVKRATGLADELRAHDLGVR